jgi:glycerate kinase
VDALAARISGVMRDVEVENAVGTEKVFARYLLDRLAAVAYLEMASASGLALLEVSERDPLLATTLGTGKLIQDALTQGAKRIVIGLGGSATNDGGTGIARAFGYRFLDASGAELTLPQEMARLETILPPETLPELECVILADVTNPLLGPDGATAVYGPQKGVTEETHELLESGLECLADVVARDLGCDAREMPGAGAAGGCAYGLMSFLGAQLVPGFDYVSEQMGIETAIASADWVITGEGRMDFQTLSGKGPIGVAALAKAHGKLVVAICGDIEPEARPALEERFTKLMALTDACTVEEALANPQRAIEKMSATLRL